MTEAQWLQNSTLKGKADLKAFAQARAKKATKAEAARVKQVQAAQTTTKASLRGFWKQHPKTCSLFGEIMRHRRASYATRPSKPGYWAAYPYPQWTGWTTLPVATLKRHLHQLEEHGLIERELGKHAGSRVIAFIRPTALALSLSDVTAKDWTHLGEDRGTWNEKPSAPILLNKPKPAPKIIIPEDEKPANLAEILAIINSPNPSQNASD